MRIPPDIFGKQVAGWQRIHERPKNSKRKIGPQTREMEVAATVVRGERNWV